MRCGCGRKKGEGMEGSEHDHVVVDRKGRCFFSVTTEKSSFACRCTREQRK